MIYLPRAPVFTNAIERLRQIVDWPAPAACAASRALVMSGGGARSAYQVGVIRYLAEAFPEAGFPILTGVSAGAINAAHLANYTGSFEAAARHLVDSWSALSVDRVFEPESSFALVRGLIARGNGAEGGDGAADLAHRRRGLVNTAPLRAYLEEQLQTEDGRLSGVVRNLQTGRLRAFALTATNYTTGQTTTWVQGRNIERWERPGRVSVNTAITVDHILASTSLPLLFPAVPIGEAWYGDGGIRLLAPLSPAIQLGADRVLVISTRYEPSPAEADEPDVAGYPPAAQIIGTLMNAIFLDTLDRDAVMLDRLNALLERLPQRKRDGLRPIRLLLIRPSVDLGKLAAAYEVPFRGALGLLTRGLGTGETRSPDWLSMLLFEEEYLRRLIEIGYEDARRQHDEVEAFLLG